MTQGAGPTSSPVPVQVDVLRGVFVPLRTPGLLSHRVNALLDRVEFVHTAGAPSQVAQPVIGRVGVREVARLFSRLRHPVKRHQDEPVNSSLFPWLARKGHDETSVWANDRFEHLSTNSPCSSVAPLGHVVHRSDSSFRRCLKPSFVSGDRFPLLSHSPSVPSWYPLRTKVSADAGFLPPVSQN